MGRRRRYSAAFKLLVIKEAEKNGIRPAAREYRVSRSCVQDWVRAKEDIVKMPKSHTRKGNRKAKWPELENILAEWVKISREKGTPISSVGLRLKALSIAKEINAVAFTATVGWYRRFLKRNKFTMRVKTSVGQSLPSDWEVKVELFHSFVKKIMDEKIMGFDDLFNMDETPLSFDAPPNRTINCIGAKSVRIKTTGHEKTNFTCVLCCSATGEKLSPMVIFKRKTIPKEKIPDGIIVMCNNKGWMTEDVMLSWFEKVYKERQDTANKSLLVLDSMKSHLQESVNDFAKHNKTNLAVIPGGLTKIVQPLDLTINRSFKLEIRRCWEKWMLDGPHTFTKGGHQRKATFAEVCSWVLASWDAVKVSTIVNAFQAAGIIPRPSNVVAPVASTSTAMANTPISDSESDEDEDEDHSHPALDLQLCKLFNSDSEESDFDGFESEGESNFWEAFNSDSDESEFEGFHTESD